VVANPEALKALEAALRRFYLRSPLTPVLLALARDQDHGAVSTNEIILQERRG
jgi:hypothetical protein